MTSERFAGRSIACLQVLERRAPVTAVVRYGYGTSGSYCDGEIWKMMQRIRCFLTPVHREPPLS